MTPSETWKAGLFDWERDLVDWAYRDEPEVEQGEEFAIGHRSCWKCLLPCANDSACPQADYILWCVDLHLLEYARLKDRTAFEEALTLLGLPETDTAEAFAGLQIRRLAYLDGSAPADRQAAVEAGRDFLVQFGEAPEVTKVALKRESDAEWVVERLSGFGIVKFDRIAGGVEIFDRP